MQEKIKVQVKNKEKKLLGSQFDVSKIESHPDGLECQDHRRLTYAKQPCVLTF